MEGVITLVKLVVDRDGPTFVSGAQVMAFDPLEKKWFDARVKSEPDRGKVEVELSTSAGKLESRTLPCKHVLHDCAGQVPGLILREAAVAGSAFLVRALLEVGVSPFESDRECNTALHYAAANGQDKEHVRVCKHLMSAGADPNVCSRVERSARGMRHYQTGTQTFGVLSAPAKWTRTRRH